MEKCPSNFKLLVSGSSDNHFHLLLLFLYRVYIIESNICVVVWNLGLSANNSQQLYLSKKYLEKRDIIVEVEVFNYSNFPCHFDIRKNAGYYSWKPFIIWNTYIKYKKSLLYLDCGCYVSSKLNYEFDTIRKNKFFTINATHTIKKFTHPSLLKIFDVNDSVSNKRMCSAGIIGIYYYSYVVEYIFKLWKACALIKKCIAPSGSNRGNHLQDQSVLSIILHQNNINFYNNIRKDFIIHFDDRYRSYNDTFYTYFLKTIKGY